jgi:hypothetical protein
MTGRNSSTGRRRRRRRPARAALAEFVVSITMLELLRDYPSLSGPAFEESLR